MLHLMMKKLKVKPFIHMAFSKIFQESNMLVMQVVGLFFPFSANGWQVDFCIFFPFWGSLSKVLK